MIVSSVGAELRDFVCRDAARRLWTAARVAPGERVTLQRASEPRTSPWRDGSEPSESAQTFYHTAVLDLDAAWFARASDLPDVAPIATLRSIHWADDELIITGPLTRRVQTEEEGR